MDLERGGIVGRQRRAAGGAKGISEAGGGEGGPCLQAAWEDALTSLSRGRLLGLWKEEGV